MECLKEHIGSSGMFSVRRRDTRLKPLLESGCGAMPERDKQKPSSSGRGMSTSQSLRFDESMPTGMGEASNKPHLSG
ncbi:MAG: hypothetical protein M1597_04250 [Candidatus Thermoplasmatota archaeon]|nr:hypothetical protein [Candidatus Thermoplasmatota archaeon]